MYPFFEANNSGNQDFFNSAISTNFSYPPHLHPYIEIAYVVEGTTEITINDRTSTLNSGDSAISFPNDVHSYNNKEFSKILIFIFSSEITSDFFSKRMNKTLENSFFTSSLIGSEITPLFTMLREEFTAANNKYVIKGLLYAILGRFDPYFKLKNSEHSYNSTTQSLLSYIENHYHENISLDSVAHDLGFSKFYLSRIFSNKIGYQFNDYVNRLRINKAQKLLSESQLSITSIAMECGFESQRNFNRIFKEHTNMTPSEFKSSLLES